MLNQSYMFEGFEDQARAAAVHEAAAAEFGRAPSVREMSVDALLAALMPDCLGAVHEAAERLGGMGELARADWRMIAAQGVKGLTEARAQKLAAAFELGRRAWAPRGFRAKPIRQPRDVRDLLAPLVKDDEQENFFVLLLDARRRLLCDPVLCTRGTVDSSPVHPREAFREAIRHGAQCVIFAHNHPSGDATPSAEDLNVTRRLVEAGRLVQVPVIDHIVIGAEGIEGPAFVSIRDSGVEF